MTTTLNALPREGSTIHKRILHDDFSLSTGAGATSARSRKSKKVRAETIGFFGENRRDNGLGVACGTRNAEAIRFSQGFRVVMSVRITAMNSRAYSRVEDGHERKISFVDASSGEFNDRDVIPRAGSWLGTGG